jgi:hypothetical protein
MRKKKLAVLGRGTAGVLSMAQLINRGPVAQDAEIEWYFDSNVKPQAVGEGSTLDVPSTLLKTIGFFHNNLHRIDGTVKQSIRKMNWGKGNDFYHPFPPPAVGYHFNAIELQKYIFEKLKDQVTLIDQNITSDQIDADYIIDCSGTPTNADDIETTKYIPVNAAYVTQCYWELPRFFDTLTIARPYGWVFGIPLKNRCSIGYMFNDNINSVEEVKEDVKNIFDEFNLIPSTTTNELHFRNYHRKVNFTERVAYNGNASFFLEPLEATTLSAVILVNKLAHDIIKNPSWKSRNNFMYLDRLKKTERMIMFHYFAGSKFKTPFWDYAEERGRTCLEEAVTDNNWMKKYELSKQVDIKNTTGLVDELQRMNYKDNGGEDWSTWNYYANLSSMGLDIYDKIDALKQ